MFSLNNIESVRETFSDVGTCIVTDLVSPKGLEQLSEYYLPWYWPNGKQIGLGQYVNQFRDKNANLTGYLEVQNLVDSLRAGVKAEIEIIIAFDTSINAGVVVDGTKRAVALFAIKEENDGYYRGVEG